VRGPLGPDHLDVATSLNDLGSLLWNMGDLAGARPLFERALAIREKVFGPDHENVAKTLDGLAETLRKLGETLKAAELDARAKAIRAKNSAAAAPSDSSSP